MLQKKEMVVILLAGMCCLGTAFCEEQAQKAPDPYENTSVLVEAFVVRVSNAALAEAGVNPIGQSPEGISILKIPLVSERPGKSQGCFRHQIGGSSKQGSRVFQCEEVLC
jgi:hypothetical protein